MSEQEQNPKPADADSNWAELKATEGDKYRVKASDYDVSSKTSDEDSPSASGPSFSGVSVWWTNGSDGSPSSDVQNKTSITWYKLTKTPWYNVVYTYELSFNCKDTYNFAFTDATGDTYFCDVWQNGGTHYVQFNSSNPTITRITGS